VRETATIQSLFKNDRDYTRSVQVIMERLRSRDNTAGVGELVEAIVTVAPYANRNHIAEVVIRERGLMFRGEDTVVKRVVKYVTPPDELWFGTVEGLAHKFRRNGARSNTKGYVKLYSSRESATKNAEKFVRDGDCATALLVDAKSMIEIDGCAFSTYEEGEFCVREIPASRFIQVEADRGQL
jgi:RNA:NAD 2'-phosphotransferase (TPT1/KptA family)